MANKRLIDANALKEVLERYLNAPHIQMQYSTHAQVMRSAIQTCIELVDIPKTVDAVEVVHGKWEKQVEDGMYWYECSECGGEVPKTRYKHDWYSAYCPNCGAKMDGGNEDG